MSSEPPRQYSPQSEPKPHLAWRALRVYERFEIVTAVVALILAMRQFMLIDSTLLGFCLFWTAPAFLATAATLHPRTPRGLRTVATIYVTLVCIGSWLAPIHGALPHLGGEHPGGTEFAERWNRLDVSSRRLIEWNMALGGVALFFGTGYPHWADLRRYRRGQRHQMSPFVCCLALAVLWGIPLLMLPLLFLAAM